MQHDNIVGYCAGCTLEIYQADIILEFDSKIVHDDFECLKLAVDATKNTGYKYQQEQIADLNDRVA